MNLLPATTSLTSLTSLCWHNLVRCCGFGLLLIVGLGGVSCSKADQCTFDGDCKTSQRCVQKKCQSTSTESCTAHTDCTAPTSICDPQRKRCVACLRDIDCAEGKRCVELECKDVFPVECRSDAECAGKAHKFCTGNGTCAWDCLSHKDCTANQECQNHACVNKSLNPFCVKDDDCREQAKRFCSTSGNCEWSCRQDSDCSTGKICQEHQCVDKTSNPGCKTNTDCAGKLCKTQTGQCVSCLQDSDCSAGKKCDSGRNECAECIQDTDCPTSKPRCIQQQCQDASASGCGQGCSAQEFCVAQERCLKSPISCQDDNDCDADDICLDLGDTRTGCLPTCDPTQNKSSEDLTNPGCWGGFGWCYSISDEDPQDGACFPPQRNIRNWKEECGNEEQIDKPEYHLCVSGLHCVEDGQKNVCWKSCDPAKNVGGKSDVVDKNPDCDQGKGLCHPIDQGKGACEPDSGTNPTTTPPVPGDVVINEILSDPPDDISGDANKDGTRHAYSDEFIEIVNISTKTLTFDGLQIVDANTGGTVRFTFPKGTVVASRQAIVVFGGGMTSDTQANSGKPHPKFGNALVFTVVQGDASSSSGLVLSNTGKKIQLLDASGKPLSEFVYGGTGCEGDKNQSVTRSPDLTGVCKLHKDSSSQGLLYSPGTQSDGKSF